MTRYPLCWPAGWKRTPAQKRKDAQFSKTGTKQYGDATVKVQNRLSVADGTARVLYELERLGVQQGDAIISTNIQVRLDGLPYSNRAEPSDPGVAVYWNKGPERQTKVMAIDRYTKVADNLAAIAASLEAMRSIERHGGATILDRAFMGFEALPAPKGWREILGVEDWVNLTLELVRKQHRAMAFECHPDRGGSHERMAEINRAWEEAQKELGGGRDE